MPKNCKYTFFYSLSDRDIYTWLPGAGPTDNLVGIGIHVAQGQQVELPLQMDFDADYILSGLSMQAYWYDSANGQYWWYEPQLGLDTMHSEQTDIIGTPLVHYIRIRLLQLSPSKQYIIGSQNDGEHIRGNMHQVSPSAFQGNEDGKRPAQMGTHLVERGGLLSLSVANEHETKDLIITGIYHGHKVKAER